jgi:uncharacterized membrane protein YdjX (TVP38/TMEM64 family)
VVSLARRRALVVAGLGLVAAGLLYSYATGGFFAAFFGTTRGEPPTLDVLREYLARWGALAPLAYVLIVIVEVLVAPLPGTLLYAPGGAIFGGLLGGTLSLAGNVAGAAIAAFVARTWSGRLARAIDAKGLAPYRTRLTRQGVWVVLLLRINPLTSSDLVSYAAGAVGVPVWRVAAGTLIGMAPLCYAQAYLAERLFDALPWSLWIVVGLGAAYGVAVIWIIAAVGRRTRDSR